VGAISVFIALDGVITLVESLIGYICTSYAVVKQVLFLPVSACQSVSLSVHAKIGKLLSRNGVTLARICVMINSRSS